MALTKVVKHLSSTPSIVDGGNATAITIDSSENVTLSGHLNLGDNDYIKLGDSSDLLITHDGSGSWIIDNGTGGLVLASNSLSIKNAAYNEQMITAYENGAVELYHDNNKKLETTSSGVTVTGTITGALASSVTGTTQSAGTNNTTIATTAYTDAAITALVGGAPSTLDTLNEIAASINDDANYVGTVNNLIAGKAPLASPTFTGGLTLNNGHVNIDSGLSYQWGDSHERIEQSDGKIEFFTNNGEQMTLSGSNLGIGDINPADKLSIKADTGHLRLKSLTTATKGLALLFDHSNNRSEIRSDQAGVNQLDLNYYALDHHFGRNVSNITMTLTDLNKVGIGTTGPFTKFHIKDTAWSSGSPYGTVQLIEGNNVNDNNWGHLVITDTTTSNGNGGSIRFATGAANALNPFSGIQGTSEGATYGGLAFYTRPQSGTATERMKIDSGGHTSFTLNTNAMGTFGDGIGEVGSGNFALQVSNSAGSALKPLGFRAEDIRFATGSSERMRIGSGGAIDIGNNQLGWYDNANSSWQTGVLRFDDLNFKNAGGSSLLLIDGGANTVTASGTLSSVNGLHSNHHQVYGTGTSGFLISLNVATNNYAFIIGEIKLEQFNFSTIQTIEFSATVLNTGLIQSVKASCDVPVTIKLFNYSNSWYIWVPSPSTFTTCSAYIHMGGGYQGSTRGSNCINTLSHAGVPSSGVTNSTDIVCEQRIKANSSGNVGIGTTNPGAKLEVSGKDDAGASDLLRLQFDNSPGDTGITFTDINSTIKNRITMDSTNTADLRISSGTKIHLYGGTTNGTSSPHLTVDNSGCITTPNQPGFFARGNTSQWLQGSSSGAWNTIVAGIAHGNGTTIGVNLTEGAIGHLNGYDAGSDFNTSNGRFTAPNDGKYVIHGSLYCAKTSTNANDYMHFLVYVNGQQINQMYTMGGHKQAYAHDFSLNLSTILRLDANDYVEWKIYTTSTSMRIYGDHLCIGAHMIS